MDFHRSKEESDFILHVNSVLNEHIVPNLRDWKKENTTPPKMFQILGKSGLLGFMDRGGELVPRPWQSNIYFYREMAQVSGGCAIATFAHAQLGVQSMYYFGNEEQRKRYMFPGAAGKKIIAFANTEPGAGSDAASISLLAKNEGDHYIVNGTKTYITNGDIADDIVFTAVTHPQLEKKHARISLLVVEAETEGIKRTRIEKHGWVESHLSTLKFHDVKVPKDNLIGEEGRGFYQTMNIFNSSRIGISALALGTSLGAYKAALHHSRSRNVFGSPLFEHPAKRNQFADNITRLEAGWLLVQKAAFLKDMGEEFRYNSSMAKLFTTEEGLKISQWAQETFGARGVLTTNRISEYPDDAKAALIGEGAPEVQKKIVSEHIDEILESLS